LFLLAIINSFAQEESLSEYDKNFIQKSESFVLNLEEVYRQLCFAHSNSNQWADKDIAVDFIEEIVGKKGTGLQIFESPKSRVHYNLVEQHNPITGISKEAELYLMDFFLKSKKTNSRERVRIRVCASSEIKRDADNNPVLKVLFEVYFKTQFKAEHSNNFIEVPNHKMVAFVKATDGKLSGSYSNLRIYQLLYYNSASDQKIFNWDNDELLCGDKCPNEFGTVENQGCPACEDNDNDGICNDKDACPDKPGPKTFDGCPDCNDKDEDGICDHNDQCPEEFGIFNLGGCPDNDGDGIINSLDGCPDDYGQKISKGCPDKDNDNVPDFIFDGEKQIYIDICPERYGEVRFQGCPDTDWDNVPDNLDECPLEKGLEIFNGCLEGECEDSDFDGICDTDDECPNKFGSSFNYGCPIKECKRSGAMHAIRSITGVGLLGVSYYTLQEAEKLDAEYREEGNFEEAEKIYDEANMHHQIHIVSGLSGGVMLTWELSALIFKKKCVDPRKNRENDPLE